MIFLILTLVFLFWSLFQTRRWLWDRRVCAAKDRVFHYLRRATDDEWDWAWALEYHVLTEKFDRSLPGYYSPYDADCWVPIDYKKSRQFSQQLLSCVQYIKEERPYMWKAVERLTYTQQQHELEAMLFHIHESRSFIPRLSDVAIPRPRLSYFQELDF